MRKLVVLGLLLAASTGCGRGWFPHLFRGAPCNGLCSAPAQTPTLHNDCEGCNSGYAAYDDGMVSHGMEVGGYDQGIVGSSQIIGSQPMTEIQGGQIVAPQSIPGSMPGAR